MFCPIDLQELMSKRVSRDPFHRNEVYGPDACPEMESLMHRCRSDAKVATYPWEK